MLPITSLLFYTFAAILLFAALRVITARNTVHAALYLVLAFAQASCLWMLLQAEFLSIVLILVYVGAVMVLFLFVVMMLDIKIEPPQKGAWTRGATAGVIGGLIALEMVAIFVKIRVENITPVALANTPVAPNTWALGQLLYSEYIYPVQVAAVILLVAIVAAIALTLRERKDNKHIDASIQVRAKARDRLTLISMRPTERAPAPSNPIAVSQDDLTGNSQGGPAK